MAKVDDYSERQVVLKGWPCRITSYRIGGTWHCKADNVSPGAALTRTTGGTKEEAENKAMARAEELLGKTRRMGAEA